MADNKQRNDNKDAQESGQPVQLDKEQQQGGQHGVGHDEAVRPGGAPPKPGPARPGGGQAGPKQ